MNKNKRNHCFTSNMTEQMFNQQTCFSPSNKNVIIIIV